MSETPLKKSTSWVKFLLLFSIAVLLCTSCASWFLVQMHEMWLANQPKLAIAGPTSSFHPHVTCHWNEETPAIFHFQAQYKLRQENIIINHAILPMDVEVDIHTNCAALNELIAAIAEQAKLHPAPPPSWWMQFKHRWWGTPLTRTTSSKGMFCTFYDDRGIYTCTNHPLIFPIM